MRANLILLAAIFCFIVGSCANPGAAPTGVDPYGAAWGTGDWSKGTPAGSPRDGYPGPALTGGGGGG